MAKNLISKKDISPVTAMRFLRSFIGTSQMSAVIQGLIGEERQYFVDKMLELEKLIKGMPHTYQQDGKGDKAIAYLHYFRGDMNWFVTEKDKGASTDEVKGAQLQAFGLANYHGNEPELGYISIQALVQNNVELDFHWTPKTLAEIKAPK